MAEPRGFREFLREQFSLPRDSDGSVSYAQVLGRGIGGALGGSAFGPLGGAALGRLGQGIGQRVGYMFDNDDSTGFWQGTNRGQGGGFSNFLSGLFNRGGGQEYSGPPSLNRPGNRWESPRENSPLDYDAATSRGNWGGEQSMPQGQGMPRPAPTGYTGNVGADRTTWGDYMSRMTQNMSPQARMQFQSRGGVPTSGLRGAERVMAGGDSTTMGMGSAARLWGYSPFGTGLLFNDQQQAL